MSRARISRQAVMSAISHSNEARDELRANISVMDNNVNSLFSGLQDPTFQKYLDLSEQMQGMLKQVSDKMDAISEYCQGVIRWMDNLT